MESKVVREPIGVWWRIKRYSVEIEPVRVVAVTDHFVTYLEDEIRFDRSHRTRERRESRGDFFSSFVEAKAEAVRRAKKKVESSKDELQRLRSTLGQWESLKEPKG